MFEYHCPDCGTTNRLHYSGCEFDNTGREYEKAYTDILSVLSSIVCRESTLREQSPEWSDLHDAALERLKLYNHVDEDGDGFVRLLRADERQYLRKPGAEPLVSIYQHGTFPGGHDNGIFALLSYYSHIGLSWEDTKAEMLQWFEETGTWERGGFEEPSPEAVLENERHVWAEGYGWKNKGNAAKRVIERHKGGRV